MFEHFTADTRAIVVLARRHARRLGQRDVGSEHLLLAAASAGGPASGVLRAHGVTPQAVEREILRRAGAAGRAAPLDREALASIGIDLDAVRERAEDAFGPGALAHGPAPAGRTRFTPLAKKTLGDAAGEARACRDGYLGAEHLTLALAGLTEGEVPVILSALSTSPAALRAGILGHYRKAG